MTARCLTLTLVLLAAACTTSESSDDPAVASRGPATPEPTADAMLPHDAAGLYALTTADLDGEPTRLSQFEGKVTLVVNVASECGFTPQYAGLQQLHETYSRRGLVVLGFPSNEFGGQEPGSAGQIRQFCTQNFGVTFPLFAKSSTQPGANQSEVYTFLQEATGEVPNWNFCKYLVGKDGEPIEFFGSRTDPGDETLIAAIEAALDT